MKTLTIIADYPAYTITEANTARRWVHGDKFAVMMPSMRYGDMPYFFTLGSVFGYAVQCSDDVIEAYERAKRLGHSTHWANANGVTLHNGPVTKETVQALNFGDVIHFEGKKWRIDKAPNQNVKLVDVTE